MTTKLLETLTLVDHIDDWGRRLDVRYPDAVIITGDQMHQAMQEEIDELRQALAAIREQKAELEKQEPVATMEVFSGWGDEANVEVFEDIAAKLPDGNYMLYAAPVRTKDLTDDEIDEIYQAAKTGNLLELRRAVIAAYKEKNNV